MFQSAKYPCIKHIISRLMASLQHASPVRLCISAVNPQCWSLHERRWNDDARTHARAHTKQICFLPENYMMIRGCSGHDRGKKGENCFFKLISPQIPAREGVCCSGCARAKQIGQEHCVAKMNSEAAV